MGKSPLVVTVTPKWMGHENSTVAPLQGSNEEMSVVVTVDDQRPKVAEDKAFMDLVLVVDISGSMASEDKLTKVKQVLKGILSGEWPETKKEEPDQQWIRKQGDRLCIITFNDNVQVVYPQQIPGFGDVTPETWEKQLKVIVETKLIAGGNTNMEPALKLAVDKLNNRPHKDRRPGGIILLSDGFENVNSQARRVKVDDVQVDTIGFGSNHDNNVLADISRKSYGGAYMNAFQPTTLVKAISPAVGFLKRVVADKLVVTLEVPRAAADERGPDDGRRAKYVKDTRTLDFPGYVEAGGKYRFLVPFVLPPAREGSKDTVLKYSWKYTSFIREYGDVDPKQDPRVQREFTITRTAKAAAGPPRTRALIIGNDDDYMDVVVHKSVRTEATRRSQLETILEVKKLADAGNFHDAQKMLGDAMARLDRLGCLADYQISNKAIGYLYHEVEKLLNAVDSRDEYHTRGGKCYVSACISSHHRQRYVARGDEACGIRLYTTGRMNDYLKGAIRLDSMMMDPDDA